MPAHQEGGRVDGSTRATLSLRPYQITHGVEYLRKHNGVGALLWEMRLGKTLTTIRFLSQRKDARRILVVGPYSCLSGWVNDLQKEGNSLSYIHKIYQIEPQEREEELARSIHCIGYYLINKEAHLYCDVLSFDWDAVVCDETWLANPAAKITKYFLLNTKAKYRILLTGTPAPESELQYYSQLEWLDKKILKCKSYWDYRIRYFRPEGYNWVMTLRGKQYLAAAIVDSCSVLKRKDVNLEKKTIFEKRVLKLSPGTLKKYSAAEGGLYEDRILKFAGQWWNEMRRLCSGKEKEAELLTLLNGELKNDKVIIWCDFVEEVERVAGLLNTNFIHGGVSNIKREEIKTQFLQQEGNQYLVAQPQCWKWGTNLTGVDTVVFFSMPQGLMTWQQVCERTVDLSSSDSLLIISLIADNTIELDIVESLYEKESREKQLDRFRRGIIDRRTARKLQPRALDDC